jgi:hypothetical protein
MLFYFKYICSFLFFLAVGFTFSNIASAAPFISTWDTTQPGSASNTIVLPITGSYLVDWGDGNTSTVNTHVYSGPLTNVTISITGTGGGITGFRFNNGGDKLKIKNISQWGDLKLGNSHGYFHGASNLKITATDLLNTIGTTTMFNAFRATGIDTVPNMGSWDMSAVTNMHNMFEEASLFNEPSIGSWDTSKVKSMEAMFKGASLFNQSLASWNIGEVTSMIEMFEGTNLSIQNYSDTLIGWGAQVVKNDVVFGADTIKYYPSATSARNTLTDTYNWTITDGGVLTHTLEYSAGSNGTITGDTNQIVEYDADGTTVTAVPDIGYSFVDWSDASTTNPRTDTKVTNDILVTANFEINQYTITFNSDGGTAVNSITDDFGASITQPTSPTRSGYTFTGWSPALPSAMPAANTTYTALWAQNPDEEAEPRRRSSGGGRMHDSTQSIESLKALLLQLQQQLAALLLQQSSINPIIRDLEFNMRGDDVQILQQLLISKGYSIPAGATGFFGPQTRDALIKFQKDNNISPARGYYGVVTRAILK